MIGTSFNHIRGILFDLDNTLYPREKGVFDRINARIERYVQERTGLRPVGARRLRREYVDTYGTTLQGLIHHHDVVPEEYLDYVHRVPVESLLEPDPVTAGMLDAIDLPKAILTNASAAHARRVLAALGIDGFFENICDLAATGFLGKPDRAAYLVASERLGLEPDRILFVDDLPENLEAAARTGMTTVFVGVGRRGNGHHSVTDMGELAALLRRAPWYRGSPRDEGPFA